MVMPSVFEALRFPPFPTHYSLDDFAYQTNCDASWYPLELFPSNSLDYPFHEVQPPH